MNKCLKSVNNLIVRRKSVVIRQIETTKLTKAQRLKKVNYETSYLFGSKIEKTKDMTVPQEIEKDEKGINSEIYWTLENNDKKQLIEGEESKSHAVKEPKKKSTKKVSQVKKKKEIVAEEKYLPETFAKFKLDLPKPVKVTIQDALNNIDSQISNTTELAARNPIPFDDKLIRNLVNFPLVIEKNDLVFDMFRNADLFHSGYTPSVSKILQGTMPPNQKKALQQWKNLKIAELGLEGFEQMQKMYLNRGKKFHECLQKYFNNEPIAEDDISTDITEVWKSMSGVLKENFEVPATFTELNLNHPYLFYKGIVDCVTVHRKTNALSVIEWKNSDRYKKSVYETFDAPLQLCAYLSALNATEFIDNPLTSGVIVVAYNDGREANVFQLSTNEINKYWKLWLNRVQEYWIRYRDNTLSLD